MLSRRRLLAGAAALAAARFLEAPLKARPVPGPPRLDHDPFRLGVASGDPGSDRIILWTRLTGLVEDHKVGWELAEDAQFRRIVRSGTALASGGRGHALHVEPRGLQPGRPYHYRFHIGDAVSRTGRTATIDENAGRLRIALASCQHWEQGWFSAYRDMVAAMPDVVLHVGDYIYEKSFGAGPDVRNFGSPQPETLADYRFRHALYRTDPDLARAHASLPFIVTWDDHEVENDYAGSQGVATGNPEAFLRRRAAAYQAYFEHMPIAPARLRADGEARLYRRFDWGALASLHVLDTRQYRTPHPCSRGGEIIGACEAVSDPAATMLGGAQEQWLAEGLGQSRAQWTLLGQQTLFSRLHLPQRPQARYSDLWDGYDSTRRRVTALLAQPSVRNPVLLGGDVHSFWVNDVLRDFDRPNFGTIATEIVTSCLASRNGPQALFAPARSLNPHVRFLDNRRAGYVLLDVTRESLLAELRAVDNLADPSSGCTSLASFVVEAGRAGVVP